MPLASLVDRHATAARCPPASARGPRSAPPNDVCVRDHRRPQDLELLDSPGVRHGGSTSTISCPRSIEQRGGLLDRAQPARVDLAVSIGGQRGHGDPQAAPGLAPACAANGSAGGGGPGHVAELGPASTSSAIAVSCVVRETTPSTPRNDSPTNGAERDPPALWLQSDEPAARRRDAGRAAAVVGVGDRHHAGRDRSGRAARRAARRARGVPRVARGAEAPRLGGRDDPELRQVGQADDDRKPASLQPLDEHCASSAARSRRKSMRRT